MPILGFECENGHKSEELVGMTMDGNGYDPACPTCGAPRARVVAQRIKGVIPLWMTDENIEANKRHRDWLKTDKAKKMDLDHTSEFPDGDDPMTDDFIPRQPSDDEVVFAPPPEFAEEAVIA